MSTATILEPQVIHALPGRMRVKLPQPGGPPQAMATALRQAPGVRSVQANALTGNLLICFDPARTNQAQLLARLRASSTDDATPRDDELTAPSALARGPRVLREHNGKSRARIAVPGLDRDPTLSRRVVDRLQQHTGVRAHASPLTGRVLVEFDEHETDINDLIAEVTGMDLPDAGAADQPSHPLDPAPLVQSATRTVGAGLGLGLLAARQLTGAQGAPLGGSAPAQIAGAIGIVQGFPATRNGLRALLGRNVADLLFQGAAIVSLALAGSPLGLAVTGAEALRVLTEVIPRRAAWRRYEERLGDATHAEPGAIIRLESGARAPRAARVVEGTGTALERDGLPAPVAPGTSVSAGARLHGGPFVLELQEGHAFQPHPRPAPLADNAYDRYQRILGPISLAYAALAGVVTRSPARAFEALLLVNPRTAIIGAEAASTGASAYVLRAGVTVVGTRPQRSIRRPDLLVVDGTRLLTDGLELMSVLPLSETDEEVDLLSLAAGIAAAAGSPWGRAFPIAGQTPAVDGCFDGATASACVNGITYCLGSMATSEAEPAARLRQRGAYILCLRRAQDQHPLALIALRPRLAPGVGELVQTCRDHGVDIVLLPVGDAAVAEAVARRAQVPLLRHDDALGVIRAHQSNGAFVALLSDRARAAEAFAACDLAIGLSSGRSGRFPARADLLAPDLAAVAAIVEAGARRRLAVRDAIALSIVANVGGAVWGLGGAPGIEQASRLVYVTALGALADGWARLRGGRRPGASRAWLNDPRPERWGRRSVDDVLKAVDSSADGLSSEQAARRYRQAPTPAPQRELLRAVLEQLRSPLTAILAAGAGLSLILSSPLDVALISAMIGVNVAVGAWQERQAGRAAEALERLGTATARVLRDGEAVTLPTTALVQGDVLLLAPGDRVGADVRVLLAQGLEVDEAALTGESLPVAKMPAGGSEASRVVLEGSDVTVGTGRAVVIAVGRGTRLGATAAALAADDDGQSPLGRRLSRMLSQVLPLAAAGGAIVTAAGVARGVPLGSQLAIGGSIALAAVPEGLPLLAGVGEAAVARRLAGRKALVRRLAAVEALGRVDVACTDKTGTLTEGRLALQVVATMDRDARLGGELAGALPDVLLTAALASPHPDAPGADAHPTDVAVIAGAEAAGLGAALRHERSAEASFDPVRGFHAAVAQGRLCVKGAAEILAPRCTRVRRDGLDRPLDEAGRAEVQARAAGLAGRGLRVLMVAEGAPDSSAEDPGDLVALGFVGISDLLRPGVRAAVRRCREAGVRVMMLTGDHPATARAIAQEAGLLACGDEVLTGADIAELENGNLDRRLEGATVIARVTPLDKLRIVESLQRRGHTVAMTGDGVNDAPALRLADVGVAMGRGGTEVARQAADVVLADDDFATLVEALIEGRGFWRNIRRALGLLLGGNLGELGLVVGASVLGLASPLTTRQILAVNVITDALPALAVALQRPAHRHLAALAREGEASLETPLRNDVLRRGASTAIPALAAHLLALRTGSLAQARSVAFAGIVATQLAQTLDAGRVEGSLTRSVLGAVAGSGGVLVAALTVPPLRDLLMLASPTPLGWALIGGASVAAVLLNHALAGSRGANGGVRALPAPRPVALLAPATP